FSRERLQASAKDISDRLGAEGYAFANVNAVPELDRDKAIASFTFYVDPGRRAYVRKINISGNPKTRDEVIRREFRQLEGAWYDGPRIERSKVRVKRLGYFEDVNIETPPVPGTSDQVDIDVTVTEKSTGNLLAGIGYSSSEGIVLSASVSQQNIFGSGNALSIGVNTSRYNRTYSATYFEPYWTVDGISRTTEIYDKTLDAQGLAIAQYGSRTLGFAMGFGVPVTETDTINYGGRFEQTHITLFADSPPVYTNFVNAFCAGGVGSVRGYENSSLGPRDIFGNTLGGRRLIVGNAEVFYPIIKGDRAVRGSVFVDAGQVWANGSQPENESFRYSTGVGVAWSSPIGPLKFSYGIPLNAKTGDRQQRFQFTAGTTF